MIETGVIHGRFQVLHNDHLKYLLAGKAKCRHLVVGISNPDPSLTGEEIADPDRSNTSANPLTYFERYQMVRTVLREEGVPPDALSVVPFPINFPELYQYYVPLDATFFLTIYDEWGRKKLERFRSLGLSVDILWKRPLSQKGISGKQIRLHMIDGKSWDDWVPEATRRLMHLWDIPARLKTLCQSEHQDIAFAP
jgi:nicotinamide mononucleotide adenylyltransferase